MLTNRQKGRMDHTTEPERQTLNIISTSTDWRGQTLSNFAHTPFELDGVHLESAEGFIQGIKFPLGDPRREEAFRSHGIKAKRLGEGAERKHVWWNGEEIPYRSTWHELIITRALMAKFDQDQHAKRALMATKGMRLTHDTGVVESIDTSLPEGIFCGILATIRDTQ